MADEDDIKPDAPDGSVEGDGVAEAPADAAPSLPQESEESGLAEDATDSAEDVSVAAAEESAATASPDEAEADLEGTDSAVEQSAGTGREAEDKIRFIEWRDKVRAHLSEPCPQVKHILKKVETATSQPITHEWQKDNEHILMNNASIRQVDDAISNALRFVTGGE